MTAVYRCPEVERFIDAYVDGEFSDEDRGALEQHVAGCVACARRVRAQVCFKAALKAAEPPQPMPEALKARLAAALEGEETRARRPSVRRLVSVAAPSFAAAAVVGALLGAFGPRAGSSPVVADAIAKHQRDLPVEITGDAGRVRDWFADKVDFAVRPPRFQDGAALVGARLANIRDHQAAWLRYDDHGERVSVFVFDPADMPLDAAHCRKVRSRVVCLDGARGYLVALYRDGGVGYAIASDMDEDRMIDLVSSAVSP